MKRIIVFLAVCVMALCATSCIKQAPGLTMTPVSVTLKVGQSVQLHPGSVGEGINLSDLRISITKKASATWTAGIWLPVSKWANHVLASVF